MRLEYWQGSRRRPRVCGCGWWSEWPALRRSFCPWCLPCPPWPFLWPLAAFAGCGWCRTLAASLGARWRPVCGPCGGVAGFGLSVLLAWPLRALRGWRWCCLDGGAWSLPPLRFGPLQWPPLRSLVLQSSAPAAVGPFAGRGGVALVAWSDCQRAGAAGVAGAVAVFVVAVAGVEPAPPVAVLQWSRPWPLRAVVVSPLYWRCSP